MNVMTAAGRADKGMDATAKRARNSAVAFSSQRTASAARREVGEVGGGWDGQVIRDMSNDGEAAGLWGP